MKKNFAMKKLYYSISEVSRITELEQYVLRYWETEFEQLRPAKNLSGNRIYTNRDIKLILYIKKLLREEKYTIEGAKKLIKNYSVKEQVEVTKKEDTDEVKPVKHHTSQYSNEMSLFSNEEAGKNESQPGSNILKEDLIELRDFLRDLLDDMK
ncbi:MAG TPA: MerR family transcriptional regulator [Ignavibacteria bacterium]|nr:MerR family transcriptional regulator [Ignavibacteria bacterium]HMR40133.1 MerR family transcriptional regulator [Ignavibacteria bacterium]